MSDTTTPELIENIIDIPDMMPKTATDVNHVFSAVNNAFYAVAFKDDYVKANSWPSDPVEITDDTWRTFIATPPTGKILGSRFGSPAWVDAAVVTYTLQEQAVNLLSTPVVQVSCDAQHDLNSTYSADATARGNITGIAAGINAGLGLPSGTDTFNYLDAAGGSHPNWHADQFLLFAAQVMVYVYNLTQVSVGIGDALPSDLISI